ncbi:MAG: 16S rRNA (adenine(1518)-N(6)/adenine(1519)-N(6))-dimethyltransferase RsmA [Anaerolineae bacterium]|nr:16S rRNA (adenine(1518)-N(6)/adenine(1519)-N(6))-dimethyltransferase RsmA [Anaerolineae bacterium]
MSNPRHLLDAYAVQPKKSLGQNFLSDPNTLQKIVDCAHLQKTDRVLEIGPGTGSMTALLAQQAAEVTAVEVDERLKPILMEAAYPNVKFYWGDILEADLGSLMGEQPYKVVANLPYYMTSAILRKLLETPPKPQTITVTVQKEVAERVIAQPNEMSLLTVSVQFYGKVQLAAKIKSTVFWPKPDVDSAVLHIEVYDTPPVDVPDEETFFKLVRAGFSQKRKQLKNSLASGMRLSNEGVAAFLEHSHIDGTRRAETLSLEEWAALTRAYTNEGY